MSASAASTPSIPAALEWRDHRRLPIGAELAGHDRVHFRVWAPAASGVMVVHPDGRAIAALAAEGNGYYSGVGPLRTGDRYAFKLAGDERLYPDPASRFQPEGPHEASEVIDPLAFAWTDHDWRGVTLAGQVIYELHVGTFTREGTWRAAAGQLAALADLGITVIEVMPIGEFEGRFGWGYDGVDIYAPFHHYGTPDDFRHFVDRAHAAGIGVILDVVYNHLGPVGNYLRSFSPAYFSTKYENEWGDALNFDGDDAGPVREYFITNAGYWIEEFHLDGLRLDATQQIFDASARNVQAEITARVREKAGTRSTIVVAENEPQDVRLIRAPDAGGYGIDGLWNDDFHHSAMVALTGRGEAYYSDTRGEPQEFISAAKYGYLFQGQHYHWQGQPRGTAALDLDPARFVIYLQNHDQVANSARGLRGHLLSSPGRWRAMTALFLLMPGTPMLFQGQEFCAASPFLYFADFEPELAKAVRKGRAKFLTQFPSIVGFTAKLDDPGKPSTFERCKLDPAERERNKFALALHKDLLALRAKTSAFTRQVRHGVDGAVLGEQAFLLRFFDEEATGDRLLLVNLGRDIRQASFAEPLIAPPASLAWQVEWSSESAAYDGGGVPTLWANGTWRIPGESATVLAPSATAPRGYKGRRRRIT